MKPRKTEKLTAREKRIAVFASWHIINTITKYHGIKAEALTESTKDFFKKCAKAAAKKTGGRE